jgi:hypothetical protein
VSWREGRRYYEECPKCGARGGCPKHGVSATGLDLRAEGIRLAELRRGQQ